MMRERLMRAAARSPILRDAGRREGLLEGIRRFRRIRRDVYERLGIERLSMPALGDLDRKLQRYLPERGGTFVEAGANDGYRQSNTYYLERFKGWTGVLVEPVPALYEQCRKDRPRSQVFNCALVSPGAP